MVRVMFYRDERERNGDAFNGMISAIRSQVGGDQQYAPDIYFLTPDRRVLSFVEYKDYSEEAVADEGTKALQIMQWYDGAQRAIERADRSAQRGRYTDALREIDDLLEEDARVSHLIEQLVGKADPDAPLPDVPVSTMFDGLRDTKLAEYEALAQTELDAARSLVAEEKLREAQRILRGLSRGPDSFATTAAAQALLEEVVQKLRS